MADFDTPAVRPLAARPGEEIWESCVKGRTFVEVTDHRGAPGTVTCVGVGSRLRISTDDRIRGQERIVDPQYDPFINGTLRRIDKGKDEDPTTQSPQALSDDDLKQAFELDQSDFEEYVQELNEVNVRRMKEMAPTHATVLQDKFLDEQIATRWPIGGSTPTYEEMMRRP